MSNRRRALIGAALVAVILPLAACGGATTPGSSTPATTDRAAAPAFPAAVQNCGEQVNVAKEPERIVTMGHEAVELINAAGGANRIVATFSNTQDPGSPAFTAVTNPELAGDEDPSTEDVIALRPDLVVSYGLFDVNLASLQQASRPRRSSSRCPARRTCRPSATTRSSACPTPRPRPASPP